MANTQAMCTSFKKELMTADHNFGVSSATRGSTAADTINAALYLATATVDATTTAYSVTNEVSGTNYTAGGVTVTNATAPATGSGAAFWTPSASIVYTNVTLTTAFDAVLLYNFSRSNKAISVHKFGSQTITAGTLTLTMPAGGFNTSLLQIT